MCFTLEAWSNKSIESCSLKKMLKCPNSQTFLGLIYLYFKDKIVASESEGDYPKRIENIEKPSRVEFCILWLWIIGDGHGPSFAYRDHPYDSAIVNGSDCSD